MTKPSVLFVCVKNGGKSQLAAALMRHRAGDAITVASAGTRPGSALNAEAVTSLDELGVSTAGEQPKPVTEELLDAADLVVVLGTEAQLDDPRGTPVEVWETDEPSARGITGMERMRLVRDDIAQRVDGLHRRLAP
ncbi:arsenate-mycothiol transferase ArsC [Auraticoccus monumenti]|uniref:Arsenate-mycothiol transferase n=1 Tax=Auraticoccus monumenti TaxID=675864 RepID=A0A1G6ZNW7_9ACTN|nr:low molecular weight phosphatase family protein [Auraticoccus monumenti]SDE03897.1 arsenate-mycothiol transferase [Auraticoccus monumenti]